MTAARHRRDAAKNLGIALMADYRRMHEVTTEEAINQAAMTLGQHFNDNTEFIIWVLKEYGGVDQMPFQPNQRRLPVLPASLTGQDTN